MLRTSRPPHRPAQRDRRGRSRPGLLLLLAAAAFPAPLVPGPALVGSVSVLDVALVVAAALLYVDALLTRRVVTGDRLVLLLLTVPLLVSLASLAWTADLGRSVRLGLVHVQGLIAYLAVVRLCCGLSAASVVRALRAFAYLLLVAPLLMLAGVPGFGPQEVGLVPGTTDYVGYFTRLSHPFLGRSNNLATLLALLLPILAHWAVTRHDRRTGVAAVVVLSALLLTLSRGVVVSVLVAGAVYLLVTRPALGPVLRGAAAAAAVVVAAGWAAWSALPDIRWSAPTRLDVTAGSQDRGSLVRLALDGIRERPLLGWGSGAHPPDVPDLSIGVHNTYLQQALSYGVPLGTLVSACLLGLCWAFWRRHRPGSPALAVGVAVLAQALVFGVQSSFEGTVLKVLFYLGIGLGVALVRADAADRAGAAAPAAEPRAGAPARPLPR